MVTLMSNITRPSLPSSVSDFICQTCRRHQSTYRRTRKALTIRPAVSFRPSKTETADHIIFNPPSSAPSVYQTPLKFLPASDPRRKLHSQAISRYAPAQSNPPPSYPASTVSAPTNFSEALASALISAKQASSNLTIPHPSTPSSSSQASSLPALHPISSPKYHLTKTDIEEIKTLRGSDPVKWSRMALAKKFDCSPVFIANVVEAPQRVHDMERKKLEAVKKRWGRMKTEAREARQERKKLWGRDA